MEAIKTHKHAVLRSLLFIVVGFSLLLSLTLFWLQNTVYQPDNLSNIAESALQQESTRNAIGDMVADKVFADRPAVNEVVGPRLSSVVSGVLNTDLAGNLLESTVEKIRLAVTTKDSADVSVNLVQLKDRLSNIQEVIGDGEQIDLEKIPDEIVLLEADIYDKYFNAGRKIIWLWPFLLLFSVGGLAFWIYRGRKYALLKRIRITAILLMVVGAIALVLGPIIEPLIISIARDAQSQTILSNLYKAAIEPYRLQAIWFSLVATLLFLLTFIAPKQTKLASSDTD